MTRTVPACSSGTLTDVLSHWNTMPQTQDMTPIHSIQTKVQRVVVLSNDMESHTGCFGVEWCLGELFYSKSRQ